MSPLPFVTIVISLLLVAVSVPARAADLINVIGSTTFNSRLFDPHQAEIEVAANVKLTVVANKSVWGLLALLEGRADVAMVSANVQDEVAAARKVAADLPYDKLVTFEVARTRVAFAVNPANPIRSLDPATLAKLLLGKIDNWHDVGGPHLAVRVVATQNGGGSVVAVRHQMLGGLPLVASAIRPESARHVVMVAQQEPGALAIAQLGLAQAAALPEIATNPPVQQILSLVTVGPPPEPVRRLQNAARAVALAQLQ